MKQLNPPNVLLALRDHVANDVDSLCLAFGIIPMAVDTSGTPIYGRYKVESVLRDLLDAGLIVEDKSNPYLPKYEVIPTWGRMQAALGLSLRRLAQKTEDEMLVKPLFGKPAGFDTPLDVFVVMPFRPKLLPIYQDHILKVAKSLKLTAQRADDFFGAHEIMADVWEAIHASRIIIADCTGRNPNVFYEIGMAHTLGRTVILIAQDPKDVPFDLQSIRYIRYEYTPPGMEVFEKTLSLTLRKELSIAASADPPDDPYLSL